MIICEKCFCDSEAIAVIKSKGVKGNCPICGSKNVFVYDTEKYDDLSSMFDELLNIYTPCSLLPASYPKPDTKDLKSELINNWNIFDKKIENKVYDIVREICKDSYIDLFNQKIGIAELHDDNYLLNNSLLTTNSWNDFVDSLKTRNRFHTHYLNLQLFEKFCSYICKQYKTGSIFYRCRISTKEGFSKEEMGAPIGDKITDGRANAKGIQCLYLGNSEETTIYEARASVYDYVTIGTFRLKNDIKIVDLKKINQISPFIPEFDCKQHAINKGHLNKINEEMGKIMRKGDSPLDYVPTQYIADFIRSILHNNVPEYSGIEYKSVMYKDGYNLAIFYPNLFECVETQTYSINEIKYIKGEVL